MNPWPDLRPILQDLPWAIAGAVATRAYMPERATKDLDILVHQRDGDEVLKRLQTAGYQFISQLIIPSFLLQSHDGVRDIVNRYASDALEDVESLIYLGRMELKPPPIDE